MSNLSNKFQNLMKDLENNLESQKDIEYAKKAISKFVDEITNDIEKRMQILEESQREMEFKTNQIDKALRKIEEDIYIDDEDDEEEYSFEIVCPYCNYTFETELDELTTDIKCPECKNIIELDWGGSDCDDEGCNRTLRSLLWSRARTKKEFKKTTKRQ